MTYYPAHVRNGWYDILAVNQLAAALLPHLVNNGLATSEPRALLVLEPRAPVFHPSWETIARDTVAALRIEAGKDLYNWALTDLVEELSTHRDAFRTWWATHNVRFHTSATQLMRHPLVGDIEVTGEALTLPADPGLTIITYTVQPASPSADALAILASWHQTDHEQENPTGETAPSC